MQVRDVMTQDCQTISMHDSLQTAAQRMRDRDIGMLLVMDDSRDLCGIVTDRDITVRAVARGISPEASVECCMSHELIACRADADLDEAAMLMELEQIRRLLVRGENGQPVGVLAQGDIARELGPAAMVGEMLKDLSQPSGLHSQH